MKPSPLRRFVAALLITELALLGLTGESLHYLLEPSCPLAKPGQLQSDGEKHVHYHRHGHDFHWHAHVVSTASTAEPSHNAAGLKDNDSNEGLRIPAFYHAQHACAVLSALSALDDASSVLPLVGPAANQHAPLRSQAALFWKRDHSRINAARGPPAARLA